MTSVVVSHDVRRLAEMCDRIVWLDHGRVVEVGESVGIVQEYLASSAG
jgi:ABC-type polysaccharide/polyol phosphate transport system ATPase subunit